MDRDRPHHAADPETTEDARPAARVASVVTLHHGDCVEGMRAKVDAASIDVVVTSPPYNIGIRYGTYKDTLPREQYLAWIREVGVGIQRVLKDDGSFFLNVGNKPSDPWIAWDVVSTLRDLFHLQNVIHWIKAISIEKADAGKATAIVDDVSVGHYKPINSDRYLNDCHEFVFHLTKLGETPLDRLGVGVKYQDKSNIARWASTGKKDLRCRGNTWFVPYETIQFRDKDRPHPATFPVKLAEMCLRVHGAKKGTRVLDPFMGLGSTAVAAVRVGADAVGFDVDETYLAHARERVHAELHAPPRRPTKPKAAAKASPKAKKRR